MSQLLHDQSYMICLQKTWQKNMLAVSCLLGIVYVHPFTAKHIPSEKKTQSFTFVYIYTHNMYTYIYIYMYIICPLCCIPNFVDVIPYEDIDQQNEHF